MADKHRFENFANTKPMRPDRTPAVITTIPERLVHQRGAVPPLCLRIKLMGQRIYILITPHQGGASGGTLPVVGTLEPIPADALAPTSWEELEARGADTHFAL